MSLPRNAGVICIVATWVSAAGADTIQVPADAPTIQIAIQDAQPFDTIIVAPGTYFEAINYMGKVIAIQSEDPNDPATVEATIIDAGGLGNVVTFSGSEGDVHSTLNGFTITGGTNGIEGNSTEASIQNCDIHGNTSIGVTDVRGGLLGCRIFSNGFVGVDNCRGSISRCAIYMNKSDGVRDCINITINDSSITDNLGTGISQSDGSMTRCDISGNSNNGS